MLKYICKKKEFNSLFDEYWKLSDSKKFFYTELSIKFKYQLKSTAKLENLIKENGYAYIDLPEYCCIECGTPYKFYNRRDFKGYVSKFGHTCIFCKEKIIQEDIERSTIIDFHIKGNFNKIFEQNISKNNEGISVNILNELNYIELVYLYIIIINMKVDINGKINLKKFYLFLHEEFYKKNNILKGLVRKGLVFFNPNFFIVDYLIGLKKLKVIDDDYYFNELFFLQNSVKLMNINTFNIILIPYDTNLFEYKNKILNTINQYKFSLKDLEEVSSFIHSKRRSEIFFLIDVINYNNNFTMHIDNGVLSMINKIEENFNLKKIYGYMNCSVNSTLYILDSFDDKKRVYLKNKVLSNIFKTEKNFDFFERNLPRNYRKSGFLKFVEKHYKLENNWEDVQVSEFIKSFFYKLECLNRIKPELSDFYLN